MQFLKATVLCATALFAIVLAQSELKITSAPSAVQGGKSYTIEWTGGDGSPATILLREGPSNDLKTVSTLTTTGTGGKFTWNVDNSLVTNNDYALQISEGSETNYWAVSVAAAGTASASSSSASSTSASSSSSSASSSSSSASHKSSSTTSGSSTLTTKSSTSASTTSHKGSKTTSSASTSSSSASSSSSSAASSASSAAAAPSSGSSANNANLKSNAALVLGAVAAIAYLG